MPVTKAEYWKALYGVGKKLIREFAWFDANNHATQYILFGETVSRKELIEWCLLNLRIAQSHKDRSDVAWGALAQLIRKPKQYKTITLIKRLEKDLEAYHAGRLTFQTDKF